MHSCNSQSSLTPQQKSKPFATVPAITCSTEKPFPCQPLIMGSCRQLNISVVRKKKRSDFKVIPSYQLLLTKHASNYELQAQKNHKMCYKTQIIGKCIAKVVRLVCHPTGGKGRLTDSCFQPVENCVQGEGYLRGLHLTGQYNGPFYFWVAFFFFKGI